MSVVAITASRTSPGATTLATGLALAWSHMVDRALLVEADPAGGVLALRFELGAAPSMTTLGSDVRNAYDADLLWKNTQDLRGVRCIPSPVDPRLARSWIERLAPTLVSNLPTLGAPTVIDLGWVDEGGVSAPLAAAADTTLVVTSPEIAEVQSLLFQIRRLEAQGANVALVTIGNTPNDPQEIASIAGVPLAAVLPNDPKVATALTGGKFAPNKFRRSLLWRTINGLADALLDQTAMNARAKVPSPESAAAELNLDNISAAADAPQHVVEVTPATTNTPAVEAQPIPDFATVPDVAPVPVLAAADLEPAAEQSFWKHKGVQADDLFVDAQADESAWAPGPLEDLAPVDISSAAVDRNVAPTYNPAAIVNAPAVPSPVIPSPVIPSPVIPSPVIPNQIEPRAVAQIVIGTALNSPNEYRADVDDLTRVSPSPASPVEEATSETYVVLGFADGTLQQLAGDQPLIVGRHRGCDVVLQDSQVSRQHGRFTKTPDGWRYTDLGSRNGSALNGTPCLEHLLSSGDRLTIGRADVSIEITSTREMENA